MTAIEGSEPFDFTANFFDSRDVIARIAYLVSEWENQTEQTFSDYAHMSTDDYQAGGLTEDEAEELHDLLEFQTEGESFFDWNYGTTFIRDSYFETYAREFAEDIGAIDPNANWPLTYIDWGAAAEALLADYVDVTLRGTTYWAR